jgi:hypothetical protein
MEAMLVAKAAGMEEDLLAQLADFDRSPIRETIDMYLRTHIGSARRRYHEMRDAEAQLRGLGVPLILTEAALRRYSHTLELAARFPSAPAGGEAAANLDWLLDAERKSGVPADRDTSA